MNASIVLFDKVGCTRSDEKSGLGELEVFIPQRSSQQPIIDFLSNLRPPRRSSSITVVRPRKEVVSWTHQCWLKLFWRIRREGRT